MTETKFLTASFALLIFVSACAPAPQPIIKDTYHAEKYAPATSPRPKPRPFGTLAALHSCTSHLVYALGQCVAPSYDDDGKADDDEPGNPQITKRPATPRPTPPKTRKPPAPPAEDKPKQKKDHVKHDRDDWDDWDNDDEDDEDDRRGKERKH